MCCRSVDQSSSGQKHLKDVLLVNGLPPTHVEYYMYEKKGNYLA